LAGEFLDDVMSDQLVCDEDVGAIADDVTSDAKLFFCAILIQLFAATIFFRILVNG
jgi:hypothetical protein